ncbi:MAG: hypothetical protein ACKPKO_29105, partial [Candidatus Fonsibacter sp.]
MLRIFASQPNSVLAFVVDNVLVPLSCMDCWRGCLVLGQLYPKSSWARLTTSLLSSALTLSKTARNAKVLVIWDVGVRSTPSFVPNVETLLHT